MMENVSVLKIRDKDADQEALAIVRSVNGLVALTLSLEHEGDVQVVFTPSECMELVSRLEQAATDARGGTLVAHKPAALSKQSDDVVLWTQETADLEDGRKVKHG